jgi:hypothetical protein
MRTESSDIIEVIDDDADAFENASSETVYDTGGRRWLGPVAAVALVAVVGFGVATSATSDGTPKAETVTPTTVAHRSAPRTTSSTVDSPPIVPYYAANPPRGFSVRYANVQQLDRDPSTGYGYQLWASNGASATSGSWFSVTTSRGGSALNVSNAYRAQSGALSIGLTHTAGGHSVAQFTGDGVGITITSFGWSDKDLIRLAASIHSDGRSVSYTDNWFASQHALVTSVQPWLAVQSIPAEQLSYASTADPNSTVVITVGKRLPPDEGGTTPDRQVALRFLLDRNTPFQVDGVSGVAGQIVGQEDMAMATWTSGDNVFTVTAALPLTQLIAIARTVHQVPSEEWEGLKFQASVRVKGINDSAYSADNPALVFGSADDSDPWSIAVSMSTLEGHESIHWQWDGNGFTSAAGSTATIYTVVDNARTYVLAEFPRSIAETAQLQIVREGLEPIVAPFVDDTSGTDRAFAAYAFSEATPYTARIVGPDGAVLASWPAA